MAGGKRLHDRRHGGRHRFRARPDAPAYAAALTGASQLLADEARAAGTYTGKEPFNFTVAVLFPAAQVSGAAPQVPTGLLTHQVARF